MKIISNIFGLLLIFILSAWVTYSTTPISNHYSLDSVIVKNTVGAGNQIPISVARRIYQDFRGEYTVSVKRLIGDNVIEYCSGQGSISYAKNAILPPSGINDGDLNLKWWIGNTQHRDCSQGFILNTGEYLILTCVTVNRKYTFSQTICNKSNVFKVI